MLFNLFIFFVVALIFLHVRKNRKTSNEMEILVFDGNKEKLDIMIQFKQPILLQLNEKIVDHCNYDAIEKIGATGELGLTFIKENGLLSFFESVFFRPLQFNYSDYSILLGGASGYAYDIYSQYFMVTQGSVVATLVPPIHLKGASKNYYDMKFVHGELEAEKTLPVTLKAGDCLHIPALWGYKLEFQEKTSVARFIYKSWMRIVSYADYYALHFLQKMNTTYRF
jgi:hypothetical protein